MANNKNSGKLDKVQVVLLDLQFCFKEETGRTPPVSRKLVGWLMGKLFSLGISRIRVER